MSICDIHISYFVISQIVRYPNFVIFKENVIYIYIYIYIIYIYNINIYIYISQRNHKNTTMNYQYAFWISQS